MKGYKVAQAEKELATYRETKKSEFTTIESQIYLDAYNDILSHVKAYAATHQIDLVLRRAEDRDGGSAKREIEQRTSRFIYSDPQTDITADIIARVNVK